MKLITAFFILLSTEFIALAGGCGINGLRVWECFKCGVKIDENGSLTISSNEINYGMQINHKYVTQGAIEAANGRNDVTVYTDQAMVIQHIEVPTSLHGFLGVESCINNGDYKDCHLSNYGSSKLIAIINGQKYLVDVSKVKQSEIDTAIFQDVSFYGTIIDDVLHADHIVPKSRYTVRCWHTTL